MPVIEPDAFRFSLRVFALCKVLRGAKASISSAAIEKITGKLLISR
jgi:hypothetical protein